MSKEYATALFALAMESRAEGEYADALATVLAAFGENPDLVDLLSSPSIPKRERTQVITEVFGPFLPAHVLNFLLVLCAHGRIRSFGNCAAEYKKLLLASRHIATARVTSAVPLTEEEKQRLQVKLERMNDGSIKLDFTVDPSLQGGLRVELDGKVWDGSIQYRLNELKDVMTDER